MSQSKVQFFLNWCFGWTPFWRKTSWEDRKKLMQYARYSIDDSIVQLYWGGAFDPETRTIAIDFWDGYGQYYLWNNQKWQRRLNMVEALLRIWDAVLVLCTLATLNPSVAFSWSFSETWQNIRDWDFE